MLAARAQLDDRAAQPREPDDRVGDDARNRAQPAAVRVDDGDRAEHVARDPGQRVAGAVHDAIGRAVAPEVGADAGDAERAPQRERALDAPADQRAVDAREAVGRRREHAHALVVRVGNREADLVAARVDQAQLLAGRARLAARRPLHVAPAAGDERRGARRQLQRSQAAPARATRRACAGARCRTRRAG